MASPTSPPPMPAPRSGGTSRRALGLFRACPAVLAPLWQCGVWGGEGAKGASATRSEELPPTASAAARQGRVRSMGATNLVAVG